MKKIIFLLGFFMLCYGQIASAQNDIKGVLWVVPKELSALPASDATSKNEGLNAAFRDYHVIKYSFLDSIYSNASLSKIPMYEIRLDDDYVHKEQELLEILYVCYYSLFEGVVRPSFWGKAEIALGFSVPLKDYSILPCTPVLSCNEELNAILEQHNVSSYKYHYTIIQGDTMWRDLLITCDYSEVLSLYHKLLPLNHLFQHVSITTYSSIPEGSVDCGSYGPSLGYSTKSISPIIVAPNPTQDYVTISGVYPQSVTLYDALGRVVFSNAGQTDRINMSHLSKGLYILHIISTDNTVYVEKIIKQ